jgi:hypothetical protein
MGVPVIMSLAVAAIALGAIPVRAQSEVPEGSPIAGEIAAFQAATEEARVAARTATTASSAQIETLRSATEERYTVVEKAKPDVTSLEQRLGTLRPAADKAAKACGKLVGIHEKVSLDAGAILHRQVPAARGKLERGLTMAQECAEPAALKYADAVFAEAEAIIPEIRAASQRLGRGSDAFEAALRDLSAQSRLLDEAAAIKKEAQSQRALLEGKRLSPHVDGSALATGEGAVRSVREDLETRLRAIRAREKGREAEPAVEAGLRELQASVDAMTELGAGLKLLGRKALEAEAAALAVEQSRQGLIGRLDVVLRNSERADKDLTCVQQMLELKAVRTDADTQRFLSEMAGNTLGLAYRIARVDCAERLASSAR